MSAAPTPITPPRINEPSRFIEFMGALTDDQRVNMIAWIRSHFCEHCGRRTPPPETCQCNNDE